MDCCQLKQKSEWDVLTRRRLELPPTFIRRVTVTSKLSLHWLDKMLQVPSSATEPPQPAHKFTHNSSPLSNSRSEGDASCLARPAIYRRASSTRMKHNNTTSRLTHCIQFQISNFKISRRLELHEWITTDRSKTFISFQTNSKKKIEMEEIRAQILHLWNDERL